MLPGTVGGDRHRVAEQHGTGIGGHVRMCVEVLGQLRRFGLHRAPIVATVGVVLQMGQVGTVTLEMLHRLQRRGDVARRTKVVAVQMKRMRHAQVRRRSAPGWSTIVPGVSVLVALDRIGQLLGVLAPFPSRHAAWIDRFDAVRFGRPDVPGDDVLGPLVLALFQQIEHDFVVGHQHQAALVDDRDVGEFFVRVPGRQHRHGGFVDRRPAHAGVQIAGGKGGRRHPANTAASSLRANEGLRAAMVLGRHRAGEVDRTAGDVRVHVDTAGKDHHPGCIDRSPLDCRRHKLAVGDEQILDFAVDAVGWIVNGTAGDSEHATCRLLWNRKPGLEETQSASQLAIVRTETGTAEGLAIDRDVRST